MDTSPREGKELSDGHLLAGGGAWDTGNEKDMQTDVGAGAPVPQTEEESELLRAARVHATRLLNIQEFQRNFLNRR